MQEYPIEALQAANLNILVAEDDNLSFTITEALIERLTGTTPDRAINGTVAYEKVLEGEYDLVLMDHMMPVTNGIEATHLIRTHVESWKQPIIVGLSGSTTSMDLIAFKNVGLDQFLAKPVRLAQLTEMLMRVATEGRAMISTRNEELSTMLAFN